MRILVLGGYGLFGGHISRRLATDARYEVVVAGRSLTTAQAFVAATQDHGARLQPMAIDATSADLEQRLRDVQPDLVIHAAGPFQGQDYRVARAALHCGAHYVDLADGREFVTGVTALDDLASSCGRWAISGASSVPGLSGAAVAAHAHRFKTLQGIEAGISPGNRTPRGIATTAAILSYVGQRYRCLLDGDWQQVHGWQSLRRIDHPATGARWLARCEVPDLSVLPERHPELRTCEFRADLELHRMHFGLWLASWLVRAGLLRNLPRWTGPLLSVSERWLDAGSDVGLMHIDLSGVAADDTPLRLRWTLTAARGAGPQVPCTPSIVIANKLAASTLPGGGARPCLDFFTLDDCLDALVDYAIDTSLQVMP